jgi:hypothetical protein
LKFNVFTDGPPWHLRVFLNRRIQVEHRRRRNVSAAEGQHLPGKTRRASRCLRDLSRTSRLKPTGVPSTPDFGLLVSTKS